MKIAETQRSTSLSCKAQHTIQLEEGPVNAPSGALAGYLHGVEEGGIGEPVLRKEDLRLITGAGSFTDDISLPNQVFAYMVRSPHAHAEIKAIDSVTASQAPGVLGVFTGADVGDLQPLRHHIKLGHPPDIILKNTDGRENYVSPHLPLPKDRARYVGEAVAMVVAESLSAAKDAAELVTVTYNPLPAVTSGTSAIEPAAPQLWEAANNICLDAYVGDRTATEAAFANAAHVVHLQTWLQRVTGVHIEPRGAVCSYDPENRRFTFHAGSGGAVRLKGELAHTLNVPPESVHVIIRDVGGNFGTRNSIYPEFALVAWAARRLGRPVKWTSERTEGFLSDYQARDIEIDAELALDTKGNFLGLRGSLISNLGAHTVSYVAIYKCASLLSSVYNIPSANLRARAALSNTPPTHPYRSTGRPEAMFAMERLIDIAARRHGFDRVALRRQNLVKPKSMPFENPLGLTYDSGCYEQVMDRALALANLNEFAVRRRAARRKGRLLGWGVANYIEMTSGNPRERAEVVVRPEGYVELLIGTLSSGQGHETSFAQLITEWLGVPLGHVRLVTGDTDVVPIGGGSHSGRSMRLAGIIVGKATEQIIETGKALAARRLEVDVADVEFRNAYFVVKGTDRKIGLYDVAEIAEETHPSNPLSATCDEIHAVAAFPYGCAVCEVSIDPDTGCWDVVQYVAIDDVGRAINPMILHAQAHGGITQGLGQVLGENCVYSPDGQLLSASFMDYRMPRAADVPAFTTEISEVPSPSNPLGIRGGGEGGTTPAFAAVTNAIVDALSEFGVEHVELPLTSERVWLAISRAKAAKLA